MNEAAVIMPVTAPNDFLWYVASVGIRTLAASTKQTMLVLANNTPDLVKRSSIERQCRALDVRYEYVEGPFSLTRFWNLGIDLTKEPHLAFANQDCIFYPRWLENMIALWEQNPDYYALWPWSFCDHDLGIAYPQFIRYENRIQQHHAPATILLMKRSSGYRFDERFSGWELDADLINHFESNKLKVGMVMNARVDHFNQTVTTNIDLQKHYGQNFYTSGAEALKQKYPLTQ